MKKTNTLQFTILEENSNSWSLRNAQEQTSRKRLLDLAYENIELDHSKSSGLSLTKDYKHWWNTPNEITPSSIEIKEACKTYSEIYSGSVIDELIFGSSCCNPLVTPMDDINSLNCVKVITNDCERSQLENRVKGLLYLKKLWNSFKECELTFPKKSKYPELTKGEIEFIEDINNLQNYKPIQNNVKESLTSNEHKEQAVASKLVAKKPDLSKWKPRKMSYKIKSPSECQPVQIRVTKIDEDSEVSTATTRERDFKYMKNATTEAKSDDVDDFSIVLNNVEKLPDFEAKYMKALKRSLSEATSSRKSPVKQKSSNKLKVYNSRANKLLKSKFSTSSNSSVCRSSKSVYEVLDLSNQNISSIVKSLASIEKSFSSNTKAPKKLRKRKGKKKSSFLPLNNKSSTNTLASTITNNTRD